MCRLCRIAAALVRFYDIALFSASSCSPNDQNVCLATYRHMQVKMGSRSSAREHTDAGASIAAQDDKHEESTPERVQAAKIFWASRGRRIHG